MPRRLFFLAMLAFAVGCQTTGRRLVGVDNFAEVNPSISRGAQPTREGIESLKAKGVKAIINLRDDPNPEEPTWSGTAGLRYVNIPMNAAKVEPAKLGEFLRQVQALPRPIFVHCRHGRDRTGLSVAVYCMVVENESRDDALRDLYAHGYHWLIFPGIARYIRTFEVADYLPGTSAKNPPPSR